MRVIFSLDRNSKSTVEVARGPAFFGWGSRPYKIAFDGQTFRDASSVQMEDGVQFHLTGGSTVDLRRPRRWAGLLAWRNGVPLPPNALTRLKDARRLIFVWAAYFALMGSYGYYRLINPTISGDFTSSWTGSEIGNFIWRMGFYSVICIVMGANSMRWPRQIFSALAFLFLINGLLTIWMYHSSNPLVGYIFSVPSFFSSRVFYNAFEIARSLQRLPEEPGRLWHLS